MPSPFLNVVVSPRAAVHLVVGTALLFAAISTGRRFFIAAMAILVGLDIWRIAQELRSRKGGGG